MNCEITETSEAIKLTIKTATTMKITNDFKYKPANSIERLAWLVSTQITAYTAPVPKGQISVAERDWIALKISAGWSAKMERGEQSCAWHEIAAYFGSVCQCSKCKQLSTSVS